MRQLTVVQLLPALSSGGVERSTLEIADALIKAGHRSVVVSAGGALVVSLQAAGSEHVTLDIGRKSLVTLRHILSLRRLFKQFEPDVVHARSRLPAWIGWMALQCARRPHTHFVTTVHGLNSPGFYSGVMCRGERVICVSESVRAHVLRQWPGTDPAKLEVIERGIDPAVFSSAPPVITESPPSSSLAYRPPEQKLLLMPGRGTRLKGHATAIILLADLRKTGLDARLWLLGAREPGREAYLAELEMMAQGLGVAEYLEISPPRKDIVEAYRQADVVLQLSAKPEAFGRTVVEALSVGKPVIGWSHGGVGELLARYFPEGQVALGDQRALLATTLQMLAEARRPTPISPQTLAAMQARTLKVYESVTA